MRKWWKRLAAALAIAGALLVVLALGLPLWLRGPRLSRLVERATQSLCGTVRVQGGRLAATAIFDFLIGRATFFEIDGLQVVAPDGEEVLVAAKVSARVRARWSPWRIDVYDLRLSSVRWLFVEHPGERRIDFVDVFRQVAPGVSRQTCIAPRPRPAAHTFGKTRPAPPPAPPPSLSVQVHNTLLEDVSLRLDFKTWALVLEGTWAEGTVAFSTTPGPRLTFEARGIEARRGGLLRVGMRDQQWAAVIPLDHVQIDRYATDPGAPADMLLDVGRASTGRSALSGHARFTDVFPWGRRSRTAGMEMDARWSQIGDAIELLKQAWGLKRRLPGRLDADLTAQLRGPFEALTGSVHVAGPRAQLDLGVERNVRLDAALQVEAVETEGVLDPALAPFLAGRLSGHLRAHVDVLKRVAALDEATLRLDRRRPGPWPRRLTVSTHALIGAATFDELGLYLKDARFEEGTLSATEVRGGMAGATLRGTFAMRLLDEDGALLRPPLISASGETRDVDLGRLVPGGLVRGTLSVSGQVRGPSDDLAIGARFPPGTSIAAFGLPVALPEQVSARLLHGDELLVPTVRLGDPAGGAIEVGGKVVFDGAIDAQLAVLRLPLERLAALAGVPISGMIDSGLRITGATRQPRVEGQVAFSQIRAGGILLGDGAINLVSQGRATLIDGRIVPALGVHGRLAFGSGPELSARVDVRDLPLAPFASAVPGLSGQLSGQADVRAGGRGVAVDGTIDSVALAYRLGKTELQLHSTAPARVKAGEERVVLEPLRLEGSGLEAIVEGRLERELRAGVRAQVALAALAPALRPVIKETAGVLEVEVRAEGPPRAPRVSGQVSVREPLRVWPAALLVPVQVPGGRIEFDGRRIAARELALSLASVGVQIDGTAELASVPGETRLDARITGSVDGAALARRLPQLLGSGRGRATLDGRLTGTLAVPSFEGHADLAGFGVMVPGAPVELKSADGRIEAHGHTLSTSNLTLDLAPAGRLQIGSPQAPAVVEVTSVDPPDVTNLQVRLRGSDLASSAEISGLKVHDVDLQLGLDHTGAGPLRIGGDVWIDGATLEPTQIKTTPVRGGASMRAGARVAKELFPDIQVDVGVHSRAGGLGVVVPYLPDIAVTLDCRVKGPLKRPKVDGRARGDGLYSRLIIFLVDVFTDAHVRRCGAR